jgi:hypothetical protein
MSVNQPTNSKGGIAPWTGAGPVPSTPPMPGQTSTQTTPAIPAASMSSGLTTDGFNQYLASQTTAAGPSAADQAAAAANAPAGTSWIQSLAPGTTYDPSTAMATVPMPGGGTASLNPSAYSVVNGQTFMTQDQWNQFLEGGLLSYNPASIMTPQNIQGVESMYTTANQSLWKAEDAQSAGQLQTAKDDINSQVAQATQGVNTARTNLQTDQSNAWQSAASSGQGRGVGGALSAYEQGKVSKSYAPEFANLEAGLATDLTNLKTKSVDAVNSWYLAGQTQDAQRVADANQYAMSYLQTEGNATEEEKQGFLNWLESEQAAAAKTQEFNETLQQKEDAAKGTTAWENARTAAEYGPGSPAAVRAAAPTSAGIKQQNQQATASAEQYLAYHYNLTTGQAIAAYRKKYGHDPSTADMKTIQTQMAQQLQQWINQQTPQYTQQGVNGDDMADYVAQLLGQPAPYRGTIDQPPATTTTGGY